jgi:phosphoribosylformylglycinamidine cyclo-ligase
LGSKEEKMKRRLTYLDAGVNVEEAGKLVKCIKRKAKETFREEVLSEIGGFSGLFEAKFSKYRHPVLVSSCDGVGTKVKLSVEFKRYKAIGVDLVAMCINDLVCCGAEPLFFLDYISMGNLDVRVADEIISGIVEGCREVGCSLLGGETAEMPGLYSGGEYDVAGFAVGVVEREEIIDGREIKAGDVVIGLASSGLHSNGFSLVRKLIEEGVKMEEDELLKPTKIYAKAVLNVKRMFSLRGVAHITGGGFYENIPRILPPSMDAVVEVGSWNIPSIFDLIKQEGGISTEEMFKTFNMGIGMVFILPREEGEEVLDFLNKLGVKSFLIGKVKGEGERKVRLVFSRQVQ